MPLSSSSSLIKMAQKPSESHFSVTSPAYVITSVFCSLICTPPRKEPKRIEENLFLPSREQQERETFGRVGYGTERLALVSALALFFL